jgi:hypothetical protein
MNYRTLILNLRSTQQTRSSIPMIPALLMMMMITMGQA